MKHIRKMLPLSECLSFFPALANQLPAINQALRNINLGKMDYLPYDHATPGYELAMRSDMIPQGPGKPPSMGHWQIEVSREDTSYRLLLQGKAQQGQELAEILFLCESNEESLRLLRGD